MSEDLSIPKKFLTPKNPEYKEYLTFEKLLNDFVLEYSNFYESYMFDDKKLSYPLEKIIPKLEIFRSYTFARMSIFERCELFLKKDSELMDSITEFYQLVNSQHWFKKFIGYRSSYEVKNMINICELFINSYNTSEVERVHSEIHLVKSYSEKER
jgi:hypothetical protein